MWQFEHLGEDGNSENFGDFRVKDVQGVLCF